MSLVDAILAVLAALGLGFGGWSWFGRQRSRWVQAGRQEERDRTAVAIVERERELSVGEAETLRAHHDRIDEIRRRREELADPAPETVRDMLAETWRRARSRRSSGLVILLALGLTLRPASTASAEVQTSTSAYRLTTNLERELWLGYLDEHARADEAESEAVRLGADLKACREQPAAVLTPPVVEDSVSVVPWIVTAAVAAVSVGLVAGWVLRGKPGDIP